MVTRLITVLLIVVIFALSLAVLTRNSKIKASQKKETNQTLEIPRLYPYPVKNDNSQQPPSLSARSVVVLDAKTGIILFEKDPKVKHFPASTTKLMTALVVLEKCSPENHVEVGPIVKEGTQMGLEKGDKVTVETLLSGMLIASGNDAAFTLAFACSDSYLAFVDSMNRKAKELGMTSTNFENPAGFDGKNQYSTAQDLAKLAKVAVSNPLISRIVSTKSAVLNDVSGTKAYYVENINELLGEVEGIEGVKTGQTSGSGEILISKTTRQKNTIIIALLSSTGRFEETKKLIEWTYTNYRWVNP